MFMSVRLYVSSFDRRYSKGYANVDGNIDISREEGKISFSSL
jgi:hypothetical protein